MSAPLYVLTPAGRVAEVPCPECGAPLPLANGLQACPLCSGEYLLVVNPAVANDRARIDRVDVLLAGNSVMPEEVE